MWYYLAECKTTCVFPSIVEQPLRKEGENCGEFYGKPYLVNDFGPCVKGLQCYKHPFKPHTAGTCAKERGKINLLCFYFILGYTYIHCRGIIIIKLNTSLIQ